MQDVSAPESVKAGWHLWAVGILGIFWNGFGCFDFVMTTTRNAAYMGQFPQEMQDYWYSMAWWMFGIWAVGVFGALFGSIALLLRSAASVTLFAAAFIASLASFYVGWKDANAPEAEGMQFMPFVIMAIGFAFTVYAYWQSRRGVLR